MSELHAPVPPQNLDAEEMVLGAMMMKASAIDAVVEMVRPEDFYRESHSLIFSAAVDLHNRNEPVDAITLKAELERRGHSPGARIAELAVLVPAASNAAHYAALVHEAAVRRRLIESGGNIARLGWEGNGALDEMLASAEGHLSSVTSVSYSSDFRPVDDDVDDLMNELWPAVESGVPIFGVKTGFPDLDQLLTGLHPGQLIVVAARPGVGKSVFVSNIAEALAGSGVGAAFFTLEMSRRELLLRRLARAVNIPLNLIRTGRIAKEEFQALKAAGESLKTRPFYVEDRADITMTELRAKARKLKRVHDIGVLVVDYLQLMVPSSSHDSRQVEVANLSRSLKLLAKELNIPVIAVSQLSRALESREEKRPQLSDLRDSGAIEQDADVVIFLYRPDLYRDKGDTQAGSAEAIVAKQRMGATETIHLQFNGRRQQFESPAREETL